MRSIVAISVAFMALATSSAAWAVTITNVDQEARRIFVCDEKCGPSFGEEWGSARDFWLHPGQSQSFDCAGTCFVGVYEGDTPPNLGDMASAVDDEIFQGNETGYISGGYARRKPN
jgi:hypothetical protein